MINPLPPQAFTKETVVQAYHWLRSQPPEIRELATSPEILVGLFQKAKLNGESSFEAPSFQMFRKELKHLAGMMGDLHRPAPALNSDRPPTPAGAPPVLPVTKPSSADLSSQPTQTNIRQAKLGLNLREKATSNHQQSPTSEESTGSALPELLQHTGPSASAPRRESQELTTDKLANSDSGGASTLQLSRLDAKSEALLLEVTEDCNLSSPNEALRMLIALGYKKFRNL